MFLKIVKSAMSLDFYDFACFRLMLQNFHDKNHESHGKRKERHDKNRESHGKR